MKSKKAIYFTVEAIIAMMVISIGFTILLYIFVAMEQAPVQTVQTTLYDIVAELDIEIRDIGGDGTCSAASPLVENGIINDISNSFMTQLGEFYFCMHTDDQTCRCISDCATEYSSYLQDCMTDFIDYRNLDDQNMQIMIDDTVLYSSDTIDKNIDQENATVLFPFKLMLFGLHDNQHPWGAYIAEVRIWE